MARIPYVTRESAGEEKLAMLGDEPHLNVIWMAAHATPPVLREFIGMGASLLALGKLDPVLREMAIVRTGILCGSEYEVHQHIIVSRRAGMPEEKIEALYEGSSSPVFSGLERMVLRFTEEVVGQRKASDETFKALSNHLSPERMVELTMLIGYYVMVSSFLMTFEIDIET